MKYFSIRINPSDSQDNPFLNYIFEKSEIIEDQLG